jgi:hypothetical protein
MMEMIDLKIISSVPSFICPVRYFEVGPFEKGEIIELPWKVADLIVKKRRARFIENPFKKWEVKHEK